MTLTKDRRGAGGASSCSGPRRNAPRRDPKRGGAREPGRRAPTPRGVRKLPRTTLHTRLEYEAIPNPGLAHVIGLLIALALLGGAVWVTFFVPEAWR